MAGNEFTDVNTGFPEDGWKRSARCGPDGGNCVEVNTSAAGRTAIRDSKAHPGRPLVFADADWSRFLGAIAGPEAQ